MAKINKFNVEKIKKLGACYSIKDIKNLWNGNKFLTINEILKLNIPTEDKLWLLCKPQVTYKKIILKLNKKLNNYLYEDDEDFDNVYWLHYNILEYSYMYKDRERIYKRYIKKILTMIAEYEST